MSRVLYKEDYYGWLRENVRLIREKKFSEIDADNLIEELESMGKSEKRELSSRLTVLLLNLIKWQYQAVKRSTSWRNTIAVQRIDIRELLDDSPSLETEVSGKSPLHIKKPNLLPKLKRELKSRIFPLNARFRLNKF